MYRSCTILFFMLCLLSCSRSPNKVIEKEVNTYTFDFESSPLLTSVLDKAKSENKLVYVDIGTSWCLPCQLMKEDVYTDKALAEYMNMHFVNYLVDAEKGEGPDLLVIFEVASYPTLLFLDEKGKVLVRKSGATYHRELIKMAKEAQSLQL